MADIGVYTTLEIGKTIMKPRVIEAEKDKPQDIRCPKGHKVAEKKGDRVEIKCGSCGLTVEV